MEHALITGATGFIGSHLVERLRARGVEVTALVRDLGRPRFLAGRDIRFLRGELDDVPALPKDVDAVFHLAGMTKALRTAAYYTVNQKGTASLLEAVLGQGLRPRFVFLSTMSAGGPSSKGRPRTEADPPAPVSDYGRSKLLGEEEVRARKDRLPVSIIRVGPVYGPRDAGFLEYFKLVKKGLLLSFGRAPRPMSVCHVDDLVEGLLAAAGRPHPSGEVYQVGDPIPRTFEDIGRAAARVLGVRVRRLVLPLPAVGAAAVISEAVVSVTRKTAVATWDKFREYRQKSWVTDVSKARTELGISAVWDLAAGVASTIAWYRAEGWL